MVSTKSHMEYKLVIIVRTDLNMSMGKMAAQVAHAAVTCSLMVKAKKPKWFSEWYDEGQRKVVLKVSSLDELRAMSDRAARAGIPSALITDAGLTELPPNTTTCLGLGPAPDKDLDPLTGSLPLA